MADTARDLRLRIVVENPPPGVTFAVQLGRDQLLPPSAVTAKQLVFEFLVRVAPGTSGPPRLLGPATQGPPTGRFVYLNSGKRAGQQNTEWDRRAKIPLGGITRAMIRDHQATPRSWLQVRVPGVGRGGAGPICGAVRLTDGGWKVSN
jgi:hypothetical protein